jgi:CcmD family protein
MLDALPIAAPALPLDEAGKYVAAAYIVFVVLILVYVAIMAAKLQRIERELRELAGFAEQRKASQGPRDRAETPSRNPQVEAVAEELHR